ncbi:MAG: DEAD/DEAH box helicase family protein [Candidatus Eisenbacteria bacterium]
MIQLRPYQEEAVASIYAHLRERDDNPCVVIPTGGGKTPVLASVCRDAVELWDGRVLVIAHVKELLEQAVDKIRRMAPGLGSQVGVYSAGLRRRDSDHRIIVAGIQSVYRHACDLGPFDLILIDEAHMIPPDGEGMYRAFLADARVVNPSVRLIGLTATPYRMRSGPICAQDHLLHHVCYEVGIRELIARGYLAPLTTRGGRRQIDASTLRVRAGEFVASEAEAAMDGDDMVASVCEEIAEASADRRSVLIFCVGVRHARHVARVLGSITQSEVGAVFADTPAEERRDILSRFRDGSIRYLVNVDVLTTGFDAPGIDCIALVRPTLSPGLYYQMVGRGFRTHPDKSDCLVLDFGGNVVRHGPVDTLSARASRPAPSEGDAPAKECPDCRVIVAAGFARCPNCGHQFPPPKHRPLESKASRAGILSGEVATETIEVLGVEYSVHRKRGAPDDAPRSLRVEYKIGFHRYQSEWVCFEHAGFARTKAEAWWRERSNAPVPSTATDAEVLANAGALCSTRTITIRAVSGERYERIVAHGLGTKPDWREPGWDEVTEGFVYAGAWDDDELPF